MANVFKSPSINARDSLSGSGVSFELDGVNPESKKLVVLYMYQLPAFAQHGIKVGMATCHPGETFWAAIKKRIGIQEKELALNEEQYAKYGNDREVLFWGVCLDAKQDSFKDYYVHDAIRHRLSGLVEKDQEWFNGVPLENLVNAFEECRKEGEPKTIYTPRKEQQAGIDKMREYFIAHPTGGRFLLNCKMRFGKCFTTYKFCEDMGIDKILILTFVPAVQDSWEEDLLHIAKHYDYLTDEDLRDPSFSLKGRKDPYVLFLSLQNYLGKDALSKETKEKIKKLQGVDFDLVVLDEYHFGAWNERTQETLEDFDPAYIKAIKNGNGEGDLLKKFEIQTKKTVCLSGTPFKALAKGEFSAENTYTYSYFDEQKNKYPHYAEDNFRGCVDPHYAEFPDMRIFGYNMSRLFEGLAQKCSSSVKVLNKPYFSLNAFFKTDKESNKALENRFTYEDEVKTWLFIIKGKSEFGQEFPYRNVRMLEHNNHTLWLMPTVASCEAMAKLLKEDAFFSTHYVIVNLSAPGVGAGTKALEFLNDKMTEAENLGKNGTIALTVNKLTIGVTVKKWQGIFVLKDLASPESYFQSIFRAQTPWVEGGRILKKDAYIYDFNVDRAAALMLKFAEESQDRNATRMDICKLIVKYMPIYLNGNMQEPIAYDVFYNLAQYGDTNGIPLSRRVRDIEKTTRLGDDEVIGMMMADPEVKEVIDRVFAHTKFGKSKTRTAPPAADPETKTPEYRRGMDEGYAQGRIDYEKYVDFDDFRIQQIFLDNLASLLSEKTPSNYDPKQAVIYGHGFGKGYEAGVNAPVKELQSGKPDGQKYASELRKRYGNDFYYEGDRKRFVDEGLRKRLDNLDNIPEQYQKPLYRNWYKISFKKAVHNDLRRKEVIKDGETVEDANNVIQHLISRLFQFLYISVYRETTFQEIFKNANPTVFLEAVGIKKEDFEKINKYHVFQEDVLNNYIHEFFVNESLGEKLDMNNETIRDNYRNSFRWFGFSDVVGDVNAYAASTVSSEVPTTSVPPMISEAEGTPVIAESVPSSLTAAGAPVREESSLSSSAPTSASEETSGVAQEKDVAAPKRQMVLPKGLTPLEEKVYGAIWNIEDLEAEIHCKAYIRTIKNYLKGNSASVFYPYFKERPYSGSLTIFEKLKLDKALKELVKRGILRFDPSKKDLYSIVDDYK